MNATLLHAVVRVADARTTDGDLLSRFALDRDEVAFAELVRRHGPLVWAVCRQSLPHHADAEDAFQAVFLALVRGARGIRAGQALPAWLHGVAVRVAAKLKRSAARQRQREERAAVPEANRPVPDAAWSALLAAVHEEVQHLPDAERTAFVLCDLEGVRQPDAAARLGWPLGTLSGRLCKARQRLLEQLARRGIAPGVLAVGGLATTAGSVPAALMNKVSYLSSATAAGISTTVAALVRGLGEGVTMRTKLALGALLVAGALGLTGGAAVLSQADAQDKSVVQEIGGLIKGLGQPPEGSADKGGGGKTVGPRGGGTSAGAPPTGGSTSGAPPAGGNSFGTATGGGSSTMGPPGGAGGLPGMMGMGMGVTGRSTWEYKFSDFASIDRAEFEKTIINAGKEGWEYVGSERLQDRVTAGGGAPSPPQHLVLVFKRPKGGVVTGMMGTGGAGGMSMSMPGGMSTGGGGGSSMTMPGSGGGGGLMGGSGAAGGMSTGGGGGFGGLGGGGMPGMMGSGFGGGPAANELRLFKLSQVAAEDLALQFTRLFPAGVASIAYDKPTNSLIVSASSSTMKDIARLIEQLDAKPKPKPVGPGTTGSGLMPGGGGNNPFGGGVLGGPPGAGGLGSGGGAPAGTGSGTAKPAQLLNVLSLKKANAADMVALLTKIFPTAEFAADERTNSVVVKSADEETLELVKMLTAKLESAESMKK